MRINFTQVSTHHHRACRNSAITSTLDCYYLLFNHEPVELREPGEIQSKSGLVPGELLIAWVAVYEATIDALVKGLFQ